MSEIRAVWLQRKGKIDDILKSVYVTDGSIKLRGIPCESSETCGVCGSKGKDRPKILKSVY